MKFTTLINFTEHGVKNVAETIGRAETFREHAKKSGIEISEMLWLSGRYDGLLVFEAPDVETAAASMLKLASDGNVKTETLPSFNAAQMQEVITRM